MPQTRLQKRLLESTSLERENISSKNPKHGFDDGSAGSTDGNSVEVAAPLKKKQKTVKNSVSTKASAKVPRKRSIKAVKKGAKQNADTGNNYQSSSTMEVDPVPKSTLETLPIEILWQITSHLAPSQALNMASVSRSIQYVVASAPIWEEIWHQAELKRPARKYKTFLAVVLSENTKICERCYVKAKSVYGSAAPLSIFDKDEQCNIRLCCNCRRKYYTKYPETDPAEAAEGSLQATGSRSITKSTAMAFYKLTDVDLSGIAVEYAQNPYYRHAAPMQLFDRFDVIRVAREVHGGDVGIEAARNATTLRGSTLRESRQKNMEARRTLLNERLEQAGLTQYGSSYRCQMFVHHNSGKINEIITALQAEEVQHRESNARKEELDARLSEAGLDRPAYNLRYRNYVANNLGTIEEVIADINREMEIKRTVDERRQNLTKKLEAAGLTLRADSRLCQAYIQSATGDIDEIVVTMKEMAWYFRCTNYKTSRLVYEEYDSDDYSDYSDYYGDYGYRRWGSPRQRVTVNSDLGKRKALNSWVASRIDRGIYTSVHDDPDTDNRPPSSLWQSIDEKCLSRLKNIAVRKLSSAYPKQADGTRHISNDLQEQDIIRELAKPGLAINQKSHINSGKQQHYDSVSSGPNSSSGSSSTFNSDTSSSNSSSTSGSSFEVQKPTLSHAIAYWMGGNWWKELIDMVK
ncbi:hypothetical protein Unana1_01612 [Umbelopsis nana]